MTRPASTSLRRRAGLTLIELIVVLAILVALGGIAVAVAPDLLTRAHIAESVTNNAVVEAGVQSKRYLSGTIGDRFDSLVAGGAVVSYLPCAPDGASNSYFVADTLDATEAAALNALGVQSLVAAAAAPANATFESHDGALVPVQTGAVLAMLNPGHAEFAATLQQFNITTPGANQYYVVGLGEQCTLVGANGVFTEAPVHFGDTERIRADNAYGRYVLLLEYDPAAGEARYLGCGLAHEAAIDRAQSHIEEWYNQ